MFKNHFFVALRNFKKRRSFTFINIMGLTVGMTVCLLILTYARYEMSFDRFHSKADNIYRVTVDMYNGDGFQVADAQCYPGAGKLAKESFPEIEEYAMGRNVQRFLFKSEDHAFNEDRTYFVNPAWLKVFDWQMVQGDPETALNEPNMLVITESAAKKYFGNEDPMGKTLIVVPGGSEVPMMVNGVIKDVPENSHIQFNILISYETGVKYLEFTYDNFNGNNEFMYLLANKPLDQDFKERFNSLYYERTDPFEDRGDSLALERLTDIHLLSDKTYEAEVNGSKAIVNILLVVAGFVLLIAWVNYINLSTARALERGKEVGVRKVLGSNKKSLMTQFMLESFILNLLAMILTITCIQGVLPFFNDLAGVNLSFNVFSEPSLLLQVAAIFLIGSLASGMYPSLVLSNYRPLTVLSGRLKDSKKGLILRKGLVVFQFMITMLLLVGTITIYQQVNHMRNQELGVNMDQTVVINAPLLSITDEDISAKRRTFKSELERLAEVGRVAYSETVFGQGSNDMSSTTGMMAVETEAGRNVNFSFYRVDDSFIPTFEFTVLAGRAFDAEIETPFEDTERQFQGMIVNETARKALGFESNEAAIGKKVNRWGRIFSVIGVLADFNQHSLKIQVDPTVLFFDKEANSSNYASIKINAGLNPGESYKAVIAKIEEVYRNVYPSSDFDYFFLDENFEKQYRADQQFGTVFTTFAIVTIFVAILGLFGLVLYEVQQRIKEIGIRKVLGASVYAINYLLAKNFMKLIFISILLALPIAYFGMSEWLAGYAYRIDLSVLLFLIPAVALVGIALLTVSMQSFKAANENPVKSLRYE